MIKIDKIFISNDKTKKYLLYNIDNCDAFEAVYFTRINHKKMTERVICISTQIGCQVNCKFCCTSRMGYKRNIKCEEMIETVEKIIDDNKDDNSSTTSILLTGMGEPLLNYDEVVEFYKKANEKFDVNEFILSTSGIADKIRKIADDEIDYKLCFSLHTPFDEERSKLIPINKKYSIKECLNSCEYYHNKTNRKISISYTLLADINDTDEHIDELIMLLNPEYYRIQLILYNESDKMKFIRPNIQRAEEIKEKLVSNGFKVKISQGNGRDISAACGQLFV